MEKLVALGLNRYNLSELMEICTQVDQIVHDGLAKTEAHLLELYRDRLQVFKATVNGQPDVIGMALAELDSKVDAAYEAIGLILKANVMHYDVRVADIASAVQNVYLEVNNPVDLPYEQEYPEILRLIELFEALTTKDLALSGIAGWVVELRHRYLAFMAKFNEQEFMKEAKHAAVVKSARLALIAAYKELMVQLNALFLLQPSPEHGALIEALNTYFDEKRAQSRRKSGKSGKVKSQD